MTKTKLCNKCKHHDTSRWSWFTSTMCRMGHKPRFYLPRNGNPHDPMAGYRRKCDDFERKEEI